MDIFDEFFVGDNYLCEGGIEKRLKDVADILILEVNTHNCC